MMNKEERFVISVNQEDVQNIIDCYEKDIKYIKELEERINKAIEYIKGWQSFPHTNGSTHKELKNLLEILGDKNE